MTEQNEMLILKISLQQGGLHSFGWTPAHEWYHPQTVRRMLASVARQLAKISLSGDFSVGKNCWLQHEGRKQSFLHGCS